MSISKMASFAQQVQTSELFRLTAACALTALAVNKVVKKLAPPGSPLYTLPLTTAIVWLSSAYPGVACLISGVTFLGMAIYERTFRAGGAEKFQQDNPINMEVKFVEQEDGTQSKVLRVENQMFKEEVTFSHLQVACRKVIALQSVKCPEGCLSAEDSEFQDIEAEGGVVLVGSSAARIHVSKGGCLWGNTEKQHVIAESIKAHEGITLDGISCQGLTESSTGEVKAKNCCLTEVHACKQISLTNATCNSATLQVSAGQKNIVFFENNSAIQRNLYIEQIGAEQGPILIEIQGDGAIRGDIIFRKIKGTVVFKDGAKHLGTITHLGELDSAQGLDTHLGNDLLVGDDG